MIVSRREFLGLAAASLATVGRKAKTSARSLSPVVFLPLILSKPADNQMWVTLENGTKEYVDLYWECGFWECYPTIKK